MMFTFRIFLKLRFSSVYGNAMILHAMASTKKFNAYNIQYFLSHCIGRRYLFQKIFYQKWPSSNQRRRLSCLSRKPWWYCWKIKVCTGSKRHSKTAIKVIRDANKTIGSIPDGLSKMVAIVLKKKSCFSVEAEVTGHSHDAADGKWILGGATKLPCIYRIYGPKKNKAEFRNALCKVNKSI